MQRRIGQLAKLTIALTWGLVCGAAICISSLSAQTTTMTSVATETMTTFGMPTATTIPNAAATQSPGGFLAGTWKVERAIFELFGSLKEVTGSDDRFYAQLVLGAGNKGSLIYASKTESIDVEYDLKNSQSLTIAHGSRLKPLVDLYQVLLLADGSLYLRSSRLSMLNGTVYYLLRKN